MTWKSPESPEIILKTLQRKEQGEITRKVYEINTKPRDMCNTPNF